MYNTCSSCNKPKPSCGCKSKCGTCPKSSNYMEIIQEGNCTTSCDNNKPACADNNPWLDHSLLDNYQYGWRVANDKTGALDLGLIPVWLINFHTENTPEFSEGYKVGNPYKVKHQSGYWQKYISYVDGVAYETIKNCDTGEVLEGGSWEVSIPESMITCIDASKIKNDCTLFQDKTIPWENYLDPLTGCPPDNVKTLPIVHTCDCQLKAVITKKDIAECIFPLPGCEGDVYTYNADTNEVEFNKDALTACIDIPEQEPLVICDDEDNIITGDGTAENPLCAIVPDVEIPDAVCVDDCTTKLDANGCIQAMPISYTYNNALPAGTVAGEDPRVVYTIRPANNLIPAGSCYAQTINLGNTTAPFAAPDCACWILDVKMTIETLNTELGATQRFEVIATPEVNGTSNTTGGFTIRGRGTVDGYNGAQEEVSEDTIVMSGYYCGNQSASTNISVNLEICTDNNTAINAACFQTLAVQAEWRLDYNCNCN